MSVIMIYFQLFKYFRLIVVEKENQQLDNIFKTYLRKRFITFSKHD